MNEKLNALAELFSERAEIDRQILALIDEPAEERSEPTADVEAQPKRTKKRKPGKYNKANPMPQEAKEEIHLKSSEGLSVPELAKEFGVSVSTIAKVLSTKPDKQTSKNNDVQNYVCENGHEFKSKLLPGFAMCPTCHSTESHLETLNGPVDEELI